MRGHEVALGPEEGPEPGRQPRRRVVVLAGGRMAGELAQERGRGLGAGPDREQVEVGHAGDRLVDLALAGGEAGEAPVVRGGVRPGGDHHDEVSTGAVAEAPRHVDEDAVEVGRAIAPR